MKEFRVLVAARTEADLSRILRYLIHGISLGFFIPCPLEKDRCVNWKQQTTLLQKVSDLCSPFLKRNLPKSQRCAVAFGDPFEYVMLDLEELNACWRSKQEFLNPLDFKTHFPDSAIDDLVVLLQQEYTSVRAKTLLQTIQTVQEVAQQMLNQERQIKRWVKSLSPGEASDLEQYLKCIFTAAMMMRGGGGMHRTLLPLQAQTCRSPSPNQEIALSTLLVRAQELQRFKWLDLPVITIGLGGFEGMVQEAEERDRKKPEHESHLDSHHDLNPDTYMDQVFASPPLPAAPLHEKQKQSVALRIRCPTVNVRLSSVFQLQHEVNRLCAGLVCCREGSQTLAWTSGYWLEVLFDMRPVRCPLICIEDWC